MSGEPRGAARAPDKRKPPTQGPSAVMPSQTMTYPPETPPMLDPTSFRQGRLTPNLRDMIHGFGQGLHETNTNMHDILASPDPAAMYNFLQIGSPILRDFYPTQSPVPNPSAQYSTHETPAERSERVSGAQAEMNALFNYNYQTGSTPEQPYKSVENQDGAISLMSSPEMTRNCSVDISASGVSSTGNIPKDSKEVDNKNSNSQSSAQTPPPVDTSSSSPTSPEIAAKCEVPTKMKQRPTPAQVSKSRKSSMTDKPKRPLGRSSTKTGSSAAGSASRSGARSTVGSASASGTRTPHPTTPMATALAAANAMAMNPAMASLMPFACMPHGMPPQMLPAPGTVHYQGRPMAFVSGAHGTELIPMDMLAQATALQYGAAAQAAANRLLNPMGVPGGMPPRTVPPPFEPVGGSRKKRRRQLLERSGCTEEQARQNRAHALKRLRQKKTLRSQQNTVRYACRKRIAMVRPRVNGRFATKEEVEECQRAEQHK